MARVAILGTGLIGTSIGLRLRHNGAKDVEIVGHDRYNDFAGQAKKQGAFDRVESDPREAVRDAGLVILSAPVLANHKLMGEIASSLAPNAIVTDTGSTKAETLRQAAQLLPTSVSFVGGHPMAGKTETGPRAAHPGLFDGARWVVVPSASAPDRAVRSVTGLIEQLGAEAMFMDAEEHDSYVAAISHMPMMVATALFRFTHDSEAWPELSSLAGGGFKDTTRLASTDPAMSHDIAVTNREQIVHWLSRFRASVYELEQKLSATEEEEELFRYLAQAQFEHESFINGKIGRAEGEPGMDKSAGFDFGSFLMGDVIRDKLAEVQRNQEDRLTDLEKKQRSKRNV